MASADDSVLSRDNIAPATKRWISARHTFAILSFFGFFNAFSLRVNLSVAIVAMTNSTAQNYANSTPDNGGDNGVCPSTRNSTPPSAATTNGSFNWDTSTQGLILGSFFYGYVCTQLIGGWVARKFGGKNPFGLAILVSGALALVTPAAAKWHYEALIAVRILQGLIQGVCYPSMHHMVGRWVPPAERSFLVSFTYSGAEIGTVVSLILSGVLSAHLGWESVFYVSGGIAMLWYALWLLLTFDSPQRHPRISPAERHYIVSSLGGPKSIHHAPVPWRAILTSLPVWALCVANCGHNFAFFLLLTNIPTFLSRILHFNLETNGLLSSLPYLAMAVVMPAAGYAADTLQRRGLMSTTWVRRSFHFVGQLLPSVCLVTLGYVGCNVDAAVALLVLAVGLDGLTASGFQVNHVDLSPTHAGTLIGLSNTFGTLPGIIGPYVVGWLTDGPSGDTLPQWRLIFGISAAIYMVTASFFGAFASGDTAAWEPRPEKCLNDGEDADEPLIS